MMSVLPCRIRHSGMTLIEMIVSLSIVSLIMLGVGGSMFVVRQALPDSTHPAGITIDAAQALEQLTCELEYAQSVLNRSETMIEFTVADRTGDDIAETIRYEWSGNAGDPLTRQYNSNSAVAQLDQVQQFGLAYQLRSTLNEIPQSQESGETVHLSYPSAVTSSDYAIKNGQWFAQTLEPNLPDDTVSWKVTRVEFYAKAGGSASGQSKVQIQLSSRGGMPSGVVMEEKSVFESTMTGSYQKQSLAFSSVQGVSPDQALCLVFVHVSDTESCKIQGDNNAALPSGTELLKSTDQGQTWSAQADESFIFSVYGTVTTESEPQIQTLYYLRAVDATVETNTEDRFNVVCSARLLNRPEVTQ